MPRMIPSRTLKQIREIKRRRHKRFMRKFKKAMGTPVGRAR